MRHLFPRLVALCMLVSVQHPALAADFAGPHVEAVIGWNDDSHTPALYTNGSSLRFGGSAGYDARFGNIVAGVIGEVSDTTAKSCGDVDAPARPGVPAAVGRNCARSGRTLFGGVRLGYVAGAKTLLYATGGYANVRTTTRFDGTLDDATVRLSDHKDLNGFRIGAGVERAIASHAFLRAEYRYTDAGHFNHLHQNEVVTALGYRF